jgi:hypothetical protein
VGKNIRLGILIYHDEGPAVCASIDVPIEVVDFWQFRKQYIGQGELIVGPLCAALFADILKGRDIIWFIDNTSACSALIKGSSPVEDNSAMALIANLALFALAARPWYEYVDTKANPSDGLSRDGYRDADVAVAVACAKFLRAHIGPIPWQEFLTLDLEHIWRVVSALGGHQA